MTLPDLPDDATLARYLEMLYRALVEIRMLASNENPRVAQLADAVHAVPKQLLRFAELRPALLLAALEQYEARYPGGAGRFSALLRDDAALPASPQALEEDPLSRLRGLIDRWCERRALGPLARVLPAWLANDGLAAGRDALCEALRATRARHPDLPDEELEALEALEGALSRMAEA